MSVEKDKENLEKLFLKSNEKDIFAKIQETHSIKIFLGNILKEEIFLKNGILDVLRLAIKHKKVYVFNETWKKISGLTNKDFQLEIYREMIKESLEHCDADSEILKIVSNKVPFSLKEIGMETLYPAFKNKKTDALIFFFEKRRLKKQKDLTEDADIIVSTAHALNNKKFLAYLNKRKVNILGSSFQHLKNAAIQGNIEKLNYFRSMEKSSFKKLIDWTQENTQPHEHSEKWLKSIELKEKLHSVLKRPQVADKVKSKKI